jgi:lipopolysaccharide assembly outer membrane protein LptD (OstA)
MVALRIYLFCLAIILFFANNAQSQILDSAQAQLTAKAGTKLIKLIGADTLNGTKVGTIEYNRLIGNVNIEHDGNVLTCDSAHLYMAKNYVEAFGNAHVVASNGADIQADKMLYNGNTNKVTLTNNVHIVDKENTLNADKCEYNVKTKYATYTNGGTLQNDNTTVSSKTGNYNGQTKDAHFFGDVIVTNPKYEVYSDELKYNTKTKVVKFVKQSTIHSDQTTITGSNGVYNTEKESGTFASRTLVQNDENDIEANNLVYNKQSGQTNASGNVVINDYKNETVVYANKVENNDKTGVVIATGKVQISDVRNQREIFADRVSNNKNTGESDGMGHVIINDFKEHRLLTANAVNYNSKHQYMRASGNVYIHDTTNNNIVYCKQATSNQFLNYTLLTGRPLLKSLADKDSMFMKADSFFTAPIAVCDTIKKFVVPTTALGDSVENNNDSTIKKTIMGIGNVKIFTDSMQAICDSLIYNQQDSVYKMYKNPILWSRGSQAMADTIFAFTVNNKMDKLYLKENALIVNYAGDSNYYNQVSGVNIIANIKEDALQDMDVNKNAQSIYFQKEDSTNTYEGMANAKSTTMRVIMKNKEVNRIIFRTEPEGVYYPMDKVTSTNSFLSTYKWLDAKRPKSKKELD